MKKNNCPVAWSAYALIVIGALNWGLFGFFEWNLVEALLGQWPVVVRVVYALIGVAAVYSLVMCCVGCSDCKKK